MRKNFIIVCLAAMISLLTGCTWKNMKINIGNIAVTQYNYEMKFEEETKIEECTTIEKICGMVDVGNIDLTYADTDEIKVLAQYNLKTDTQNDMDNIRNSLEIKTLVENNNIIITIAPKESEKNAWEWIRETSEGKVNLSVDLSISLPKNFNEYEVNVDTGNVMVSGLEGVFVLQTDTGNIDINDIAVNENSSFSSDTGNIDINNIAINGVSSFCTDTGNIDINNIAINGTSSFCTDTGNMVINNITVNGNSSFSTDTGNIELSMKEIGIIEEANIDVRTDIGDIDLDLGGMQYSIAEAKKDAKEKNIEILGKCRIYACTDIGSISVK